MEEGGSRGRQWAGGGGPRIPKRREGSHTVCWGSSHCRFHHPAIRAPSSVFTTSVALGSPLWVSAHTPGTLSPPSAHHPPTTSLLRGRWMSLNPTASRTAVPGGTSMTQISEADLFNYLLSICSGCTLARKPPEIGKLKLKKIFFAI